MTDDEEREIAIAVGTQCLLAEHAAMTPERAREMATEAWDTAKWDAEVTG